jgi:hypothetical protein
MGVGVWQGLVGPSIGALHVEDVIGGKQGGWVFLPLVIPAVGFAFGARGDVVEVRGGSGLGEGFGGVGKKAGAMIDVEGPGATRGSGRCCIGCLPLGPGDCGSVSRPHQAVLACLGR